MRNGTLSAVVLFGALGAIVAVRSPRIASAGPSSPETKECLAAYEAAQSEREKGHLRAARQSAIACSRDACPKPVAADCTRWLGQIDAALPSVVFSATGPDGADLTDVRVSFDKEVVAEQLSTRAVPVDPGTYVARFESRAFGVKEIPVVIREGETSKKISVSFIKEQGPARPVGRTERPVPIAAWVIGAVGIASATVGTGFEIAGLLKKSENDGCKGHCLPEDVDEMARDFAVGDVLTIAGGVTFGAALVVLLTRPTVTVNAASIGFVPTPNGGFGSMRVPF